MDNETRLDYPYIIAHFNTETDTDVIAITPTAENIAAAVQNYGLDSNVSFFTPEGEKLAESEYDLDITYCSDERFLRDALLPALRRLQERSEYPDVEEAEVSASEWDIQFKRHYDGPYFHSADQQY